VAVHEAGIPMARAPVLAMRGMRTAFPGVQALDTVDFDVNAGEVMALVGENGAGKSTLIKILAGVHSADAGEILINGREVHITDPRLVLDLGVAVIHQELNLAEHVSVAENILIGREPRNRLGLVDHKAMNRDARVWLDELRVDVDPRVEVRRLSIARKQMVEIARALSLDASIIVMDEPTSSLPTSTSAAMEDNEVDVFLALIDRLRAQGKSIVYISHRMNEVFRISDRITVLRDGRLVGVRETASTTPDEIVSMMVGRALDDLYGHPEQPSIGGPMLEVRGLRRKGRLHDIDLRVREGEILGVAGLIGAGRSELARAIFGMDGRDGGEILVEGRRVDIRTPRDAIRAGIGFVPEDRKLQGLFLRMTVRSNITAADPKLASRAGFIQVGKERRIAREFVERLGIRTPSVEQKAQNLSGGNQQKVVIARWLAVRPKVLIMDEPTRGIDVGAKAEIHALMHGLARQGVAIVMISSELPEVLGMSDRCVVLREGRVAGELSRGEATEEKIMALATGTSHAVLA
jgi:ribose transport system ATP-binding protein